MKERLVICNEEDTDGRARVSLSRKSGTVPLGHYQGKVKVNNTSEIRTAKELVKLLVGEELWQVANEHLLVVREDLWRDGRTTGVITGVTTATLLV